MTLILASTSSARRAMLQAAGVPFVAISPDVDEEAAKARFGADGLDPRTMSAKLAQLKAESAGAAGEALVLGSDQVLEREDGSMLSKPRSREEALEQLRILSGRSHLLHSSAVVAERGRTVWQHTQTVTMTMRPLGETFLVDYLAKEYDAIRWSVGGYRIEGLGVQLFEQIEGSHFAILGMPLLPLLHFLRSRGILTS